MKSVGIQNIGAYDCESFPRPLHPNAMNELSAYTEEILDHAEDPFHKGSLPNATHAHEEKNPLCGDWVRIELKIDPDGKIDDLYFTGDGCKHSQGGTSILLEHMSGKSVDEIKEFRAKDMMELLKVRLTPQRQKCALLGWKTLQQAIYSPVESTTT